MEADEAFRTFEHLDLVGLVVTNVEPEHVEHFGSEEALLASFIGVARSVQGPVVACADDPGAMAVARSSGATTYGTAASADWRVIDLQSRGGQTRFDLVGPDQGVHVSLARPGAHVARNAAGALALLSSLGRDLQSMALGLASFRGVGRRWEHRGTVSGVVLIDDYAHHPTEIVATLGAAEGAVPGRVWAVFQPHLYSRTARFQEEFGEALSRADEVVVTDVYGSREEPVPGVTGELVVDAARRHGASAHYVPHMAELATFLSERVAAGDLVLTMGAGDVTLVPTELAMRLAERR
jgi:UDP-N-acetylmuramate--alanine ligase